MLPVSVRRGFLLISLVVAASWLLVSGVGMMGAPAVWANAVVEPPKDDQSDSEEPKADEDEDSPSLGDLFERWGKRKADKKEDQEEPKEDAREEEKEKKKESEDTAEREEKKTEGDAKARKEEPKAEPGDQEEAEKSTDEDTSAAREEQDEKEADKPKSDTPQVEIYVRSARALADAFEASKTAPLYEALAGTLPKPKQETDEDFDFAALFAMVEKVADWPDTSVAFTTYTQDRDGRARWALRLDWAMEDLVGRIKELLSDEAAARILKNIELREQEDGSYRLELPDLVLAVLRAEEAGSLVASTLELKPPRYIYGQDPPEKGKKRSTSLVHARLNLDVGEEGHQNSMFGLFSGIKDIRYVGSLNKNGTWKDRWLVLWNPATGGFLKLVLNKAKHSFECPRESYAAAVVNIGLGGAGADGLAGLPPGTIGLLVGSEMAVSVVPGTGFFPVPDIFYQFRTRKKDAIIKAIREHIEKDNEKRREDDRPTAWHEESLDGRTVFWHDGSVDRGYGLSASSSRQVVFFHETGMEEEKDVKLVVASTSMWAEDAVQNWERQMKEKVKLPTSKRAHWQGRIRWKTVYELIHPFLGVLTGFSDGASVPPDPEELKASLVDSMIDIQIRSAGLRVYHQGPISAGAVFVPAIAIASLGASGDPQSEAARERTACRHLRVLHHHSELFKKDYGRWPATVSELDGYVDFNTHAYLLHIRSREKTVVENLVAMVTVDKKSADDDEQEERAIDDSLYEIDWSPEEDEWRIRIRDGEFNNYETIAIDAEGEIQRVEKKDQADGEEKTAALEPAKRAA